MLVASRGLSSATHRSSCFLARVCSTDSGIPDYRDGHGRWKRSEPIRYQAFVRDERARQRYWARSFVGWPRVADARPNRAHLALAALEQGGLLAQLVTQNVDGLHQRGGSRRVIDLHGRLDLVDCLACGLRLSRRRMQALLAACNPHHRPEAPGASAPDGDAWLDDQVVSDFRVPAFPDCGGTLKPAVVFFGENVPKPRVQYAFSRLAESRGLLVVGLLADGLFRLSVLLVGGQTGLADCAAGSWTHPCRRPG